MTAQSLITWPVCYQVWQDGTIWPKFVSSPQTIQARAIKHGTTPYSQMMNAGWSSPPVLCLMCLAVLALL